MRTELPFAAAGVLLVLCASASPACAGLSQPEVGSAYAFDHYVTDAPLHRRFAVLANRAHPERPWIAVPVASASAAPEAVMPEARHAEAGVAGQLGTAAAQIGQGPPPAPLPRIVTPGMAVMLWQVSGDARIELRGTATDGGSMGGVVHVRTGPARALLTGIVRGPGSVELIGLAHQQWGRP